MTDRATITEAVKSKYGSIAESSSCCAPTDNAAPCCGTGVTNMSNGYSEEDLARVPAGSVLGLGCGNPSKYADTRPGEIVVDLGSGAGIDCFLAARAVGGRGLVIGVDMTEAMITKARANAKEGGYGNVEFRQGEIDALPVETGTVNLVLSNCVINLAPDKARVFRDIHRVLRPGGRFCVSDVVASGPIPEHLRADMEQWAGCVAGALEKSEYLQLIADAGFENVEVKTEVEYDYQKTDEFCLASVTVVAFKPENNSTT